MSRPATVYVESAEPGIALLAARVVASLPAGSVVKLGAPRPGDHRWVAVGQGSTVRPCRTVRFSRPYRPGAAEAAAALALTELAWLGTDAFESWRALHAPLPARPAAGRPDHSRPWVLVAGEVPTGPLPAEVQVHRALDEGPRPWSRRRARPEAGDEVRWRARPHTLFPLLGRVGQVVGATGALRWDTVRAGLDGAGALLDSASEAELQQLAGVVPPVTNESLASWIGDVLRGAEDIEPPLLGRDWRAVYEAPSKWTDPLVARTRARVDRVGRKWRKLKRDPEAFVADSRIYRRFVGSRSEQP